MWNVDLCLRCKCTKFWKSSFFKTPPLLAKNAANWKRGWFVSIYLSRQNFFSRWALFWDFAKPRISAKMHFTLLWNLRKTTTAKKCKFCPRQKHLFLTKKSINCTLFAQQGFLSIFCKKDWTVFCRLCRLITSTRRILIENHFSIERINPFQSRFLDNRGSIFTTIVAFWRILHTF